jgi:preprotein translocase subunit SecG
MLYTVITILILLVCVFLALIILIQNPKGGGLSSSFGGVGNQILGASRSADVVVKATWALAVALLVLSLSSAFFIKKGMVSPTPSAATTVPQSEVEQQMSKTAPALGTPVGGQAAPAQQAPAQTPPPVDPTQPN